MSTSPHQGILQLLAKPMQGCTGDRMFSRSKTPYQVGEFCTVRVSCYTHQEIKTSGKEAIQTWRIQSFRTTFLLNHEISIGSASMATTSPPPLRGADCSNSDPDWKVAKELVNFNHEKNHVFFNQPELYHGILLHVSSSERSEATMLTRHLEPPRSSCPNHLFPWRQRGRYQAALRQSLKLSKRKACT